MQPRLTIGRQGFRIFRFTIEVLKEIPSLRRPFSWEQRGIFPEDSFVIARFSCMKSSIIQEWGAAIIV